MTPTKRLLTKGDLCKVFGLISVRSNRCYYNRLRKFVLTDEILDAAGVDKQKYSKNHVFTADQSQRLRSLLEIDEYETAT
jgi:hypothetical protein